MKPGQRRPAGELRAPMLAGWLFADLLLVLFLAAFTSLSAPAVHHKHPTPTPSPTVTPTPKPRVLEHKPQTFVITDVSPAEVASSATHRAAVAKLLGELRKKIAARGLQGRQAGFVIVLAYGPIGGISQALSTANSVERILKAQESQFSGIAGLGYWQGNAGFKFKVFFFA